VFIFGFAEFCKYHGSQPLRAFNPNLIYNNGVVKSTGLGEL
jgi:hypothetical protein